MLKQVVHIVTSVPHRISGGEKECFSNYNLLLASIDNVVRQSTTSGDWSRQHAQWQLMSHCAAFIRG
jgi:hypothetical protein